MKKEEIYFGDWQRILIGNTPWEFMAEVFIRTIIIYVILIAVLRLLGKRMSGQMTITEMAVMITLGAIVAVPMQIPDRGIIPTVLALGCTLLFQRGINLWAFKNSKVECTIQGDVSLLIKNGCLDVEAMESSVTTREQIFSQLRSNNVFHLGQVKRVYLEANGNISVFKCEDPKPGLSILPQQDVKLWEEQSKMEGYHACFNCGYTIEEETKPRKSCPHCGSKHWTFAIDVPQKIYVD